MTGSRRQQAPYLRVSRQPRSPSDEGRSCLFQRAQRRSAKQTFASSRARERDHRLRLVDVREQRRFLAAGAVAVQPAVGADDRFGAALTDYEGLAAATTGLRAPVRE